MGFYRVLWNVYSGGRTYAPGDTVELDEAEAVKLAAQGSIDPTALLGGSVLGPDDRLTALSAFLPRLTIGDLAASGTFSPEGAARIEAAIGFLPTDDELRAAAEAYAAGRARTMGILGPLVGEPAAPGGLTSADPAVRIHGEAAAASPTTDGEVRAASSGLNVEERQAALLVAVRELTPAEFTSTGTVKAEVRRRLNARLGYDVADTDLRAAIEAAKNRADPAV